MVAQHLLILTVGNPEVVETIVEGKVVCLPAVATGSAALHLAKCVKICQILKMLGLPKSCQGAQEIEARVTYGLHKQLAVSAVVCKSLRSGELASVQLPPSQDKYHGFKLVVKLLTAGVTILVRGQRSVPPRGGLVTHCWKVFRPSGLTWTLGSPKPRTPAMVP